MYPRSNWIVGCSGGMRTGEPGRARMRTNNKLNSHATKTVRYRKCRHATFEGVEPICDIKTSSDVRKNHVLKLKKWNRIVRLSKFTLWKKLCLKNTQEIPQNCANFLCNILGAYPRGFCWRNWMEVPVLTIDWSLCVRTWVCHPHYAFILGFNGQCLEEQNATGSRSGTIMWKKWFLVAISCMCISCVTWVFTSITK